MNDLHKASGGHDKHKPSNFLRIDSVRELCLEIDRCSYLSIGPVNVVKGGAEQGTYVAKELVYAYAMWISAAFNLKVIRTFDEVIATPTQPLTDKVQAGLAMIAFYCQCQLNSDPLC